MMLLYKYYPAEYGREAILNRRLKISELGATNDPFELASINTKDKEVRSKIQDWRREVSRFYGMISLCNNRKNPVMWSHYAEGYKGICLGIEVGMQELTQVKYRAERTEISLEQLNEALLHPGNTDLRDLMCTKFLHWSYESEWRVIFKLSEYDTQERGSLKFLPFSSSLKLREVILGPNYEPKDKKTSEALKKAISDSAECVLRTARPAFQKFEIVLQQNDRLAKHL
ncbi:DUF2971 domain-containing protein [Rhodovulum sp. DZ06]|uniref:DUF2971 domain-containing protein n=1 Tax=Rhodovulum sp. DZ06 TaxID=3425126 RepID=UPI003D332EFA